MKKITLALSVIALSAICSTGVMAQASNSASATSGGTAITPITVGNDRPLNFGVFAVTADAGGAIIVAGDNTTAASTTGNVTIATVDGDAPTSARFNVAGDSNFTYTFNIAETTFDIKGADDTTLTVTALTSNLGDPTKSAIGTLSAGKQIVYVGGTLTIPMKTVPQVYTLASAFTATVDYN
jgi:hypothetical protein